MFGGGAKDEALIGRMLQHYETFPPAFKDNPFSYGFALFSLIMLAAVSLAKMIAEMRAIDVARDGLKSPITYARLISIGLFATIFTLTFPDMAILILWNEIEPKTMADLWATDRLIDGLSLVPFACAVFLMIRTEARLVDVLISYRAGGVPVDLFSTWPMVRRQISMVLVIALIAAGLALGKLGHA